MWHFLKIQPEKPYEIAVAKKSLIKQPSSQEIATNGFQLSSFLQVEHGCYNIHSHLYVQ